MSHIVTVEMEIKDLGSLKKAVEECGLEWREGQETYKWWGKSVGDYPLPKGFTEADLGKCSHAIVVPGNSTAYEIGVTQRRDGRPGWTLVYDFYGQKGRAIEKVAGKRCITLQQEYAAQTVIKTVGPSYRINRQKQPNGTLRLTLTR